MPIILTYKAIVQADKGVAKTANTCRVAPIVVIFSSRKWIGYDCYCGYMTWQRRHHNILPIQIMSHMLTECYNQQ